MIQVVFTNGTQSLELKFVRSIEWSSTISDESLVNMTTRVGQRRREVSIRGFINKSMFNENIAAQQQLETSLISVGTGTLQVTGASNITSLRFQSLEISEFRGNPLAEFVIKFSTEEANVHSHAPVRIGSLTLSSSTGYDYVRVDDSIRTQGADEQLVNTKARSFTINGNFIGGTLDAINIAQANLVAEIENKTTLVIELSTSAGAFSGLYTVRPGKIEFGSPKSTEFGVARSFKFECATHDDYSKEPYTLGEVAQSFAGITLDVVENVDHNRENERVNSAAAYGTISEELTVSGKKFFTGWSAYTAFRDLFRPIPTNTYFFTSASGINLELVDVQVGKFERDGNDLTGNKRYATSITLTFRWKKGIEDQSIEAAIDHFGVPWYNIKSLNFNASVDAFGNVTTRSASVTGEIIGNDGLALAKSKVGAKVNYDGSLIDLYVTSVNASSVEVRSLSGIMIRVYSVTMNAQQLDTAGQAAHFVRSLFRMDRAGAQTGSSYLTDTIQFENVNNLSKSIANRWNAQSQKFTVTGITLNISGEVWEQDLNGAPANPNKMIDLLNKIDSLLSAQVSANVALTTNGGETLPSNATVYYMLSSFSVGAWAPFVKQKSTNAGARYWQQTVSIAATAVYDLNNSGGGNNEPDTVETKSVSFTKEAPRYTQLQVLGFGTVFKRTGTEPARETVTWQVQFKDKTIYSQLNGGGSLYLGSNNTTRVNLPGSAVEVRDETENRGLTNRHTVEYMATEKMT